MRVIYSTCMADPWVKVAQKLKHEHGYEPVYWIGYEDDESKKLVPAAFPNLIYHPYFDACKAVFPQQLVDQFAGSFFDIEFIKARASFELQAIKMMDRMDPDRYSFNFMERQGLYRNFLKYWTAGISYLKPDLVVSGNVPHQVFDYVLYLACKLNHIKFLTYRGSAFLGRVIPVTEVSSIGDILDEEYVKMVQSGTETEWLKRNLPNEILERYEKVKSDYTMAEPDYMKRQLLEHRHSSGLLPLTMKFIHDLNRFKGGYFGKHGFLKKGIPTFFKEQGKNIEDSRTSVWKYSVLKLKANAYKKRLKEYYDSLVTAPDLNVPYVMVNLHYQPEMSSNPSGDIFVDQRLCVDVLAQHIPSRFLIYVKEHPSQFFSHLGGHTSRIPGFYDDLIRYPQVRLMPLQADPYTLFKHSRAVATVTGTSGWEAMVLGKPVICFGSPWYEKYSGVLKIDDEKSAAKIAPFIENYRFDERNLLAYLHAFSHKSIMAYAHRGFKEKMNQDEAECVRNLAASVFQMTSW